jgi:hypothetical protein
MIVERVCRRRTKKWTFFEFEKKARRLAFRRSWVIFQWKPLLQSGGHISVVRQKRPEPEPGKTRTRRENPGNTG